MPALRPDTSGPVVLTLDLPVSETGASPPALQLTCLAGRGAQLCLPAGWVSMWLPLRGAPLLATRAATPREDLPAGEWTLGARQLLIERGSELHARTRAPASLCLVIAGPSPAWAGVLRGLPGAPLPGELFARQLPCPRAVAGGFVQLTRQLRAGATAPAIREAVHQLLARVLEAQRDLQPLVERCNGRTPQRRRLTLQRLLRTRQLIERDPEARLELAQLARSAHYSPWHLIRMYRMVFGETPSEHAARLRLERAWTLVRDSAMPVCVITQHLGYESQSAFCRAFKNAFGLTTTQVRHLPLPARDYSPGHARVRSRSMQSRTA